MGRTLLIGHPGASWRDWLKENRGRRDLINLDPGDPEQAPPGRLTLKRSDRVVASRFYGSLDPQRAPHVMLAALAEFLGDSDADAIVQLFPYRPVPLLHQVVLLVSQMVLAERILVASETALLQDGFPVGPEQVELPPAHALVLAAQRKAQWMALVERCEIHEIDLNKVTIEGARLGSGKALMPAEVAKTGIDGAVHAEVQGSTLFVVTDASPDDNQLARALDTFHAQRAVCAAPGAYHGLLCGFARPNGEDFGFGMIESADFAGCRLRVLSTAVAPAPVRVMRLGALRVTMQGQELGEVKPWTL